MKRIWLGILVYILLITLDIYLGFLIYSPKCRYQGKVVSKQIVHISKDDGSYYSFSYVDKDGKVHDIVDYHYFYNSSFETKFVNHLSKEKKFIEPVNPVIGVVVFPLITSLLFVFSIFFLYTLACVSEETWYNTSSNNPYSYCREVQRYGQETGCDGICWVCQLCHRTTISDDTARKWKINFNLFWR